MTQEQRIGNILEEAAPVAEIEIRQEQAQPQEPQPAGIAERFVALLLDWSLIAIPYQIFLLIILRLYPFTLGQIYALVACVNIPFIFYETIFTSGGRNTLGRILVGIRVADKNTAEPLGLVRAFIRAVGYYASAIILMCGFLLAFIDDQHRALQDYLAGSVVVQARKKSWGEKTALFLSGFAIMALFSFLVYGQLFGSGSLAQKRLIWRAQRHLENIGYLEEVHRLHYGSYTNDLLRLAILSGDPVQFQRDTHAVLDRKGFRIGVSAEGYKISGRAKDQRKTPVYFPSL